MYFTYILPHHFFIIPHSTLKCNKIGSQTKCNQQLYATNNAFLNKLYTKAFPEEFSGQAFLFGAITPFLALSKNVKGNGLATNHAVLEGKASFENTTQQTNSKEEKTMKIIGSRFPLFFVVIMAVMMLLSVASAGA